MMFLSGCAVPAGQPARRGWPSLTRLNPLTYAVEPMRARRLRPARPAPDGDRAALDPGITWFGWPVPVWLQVLLVAVLGASMLAVAAVQFRRTD